MLEIDRTVIRIARDFDCFTYPSRCLPDPAIRLGDARLSLVHDFRRLARPARAPRLFVGRDADAPDVA